MKEKPWNIYSWEDLRRELAVMKPRSKLFNIVKAEAKKRGHWKRNQLKRVATGELPEKNYRTTPGAREYYHRYYMNVTKPKRQKSD